MKIKDIIVGKEYYISNNNKIHSFICESNDGVIIVIKLIQHIGCINKRSFFSSWLNSVECERYVIKKN